MTQFNKSLVRSALLWFLVLPAWGDAPSFGVVASPNPAYYGQAVTLSGCLGFVTGTGTVTFVIDGVALATVPVSSQVPNCAQFSGSNLTIGLHTVVATYNGTEGLFNRTSTVNVTVDPPAASAQFRQQGPKLVGTGVTSPYGAEQGRSVALSADGNTALVGGPSDSAAWVFTRSGGVWSQQGSKLVGSGEVRFMGYGYDQGAAVALSADGNTALVGGPDDDNTMGAAWVFTRSSGAWSQQGSKLIGTGSLPYPFPAYNVYQGTSVALSADGNTAVVGGPGDNNGTGALWVFTQSGSTWTQQGDKLVPIDGTSSRGLGLGVALSADGGTALAAGYDGVRVFVRSSGAWAQQGAKLTGQAGSVALSADGNRAFVLAGYPSSALSQFRRSAGVWNQQGPSYPMEGGGIASSADGNTILVGDCSESDGCARVFTRSGNSWAQRGTRFAASDAVGDAAQGASVALSADGSTALLGGPYDSASGIRNGAAWVFVAPAASTIGLSASPNPSLFGQAVTLTATVTTGATGTVTFSVDGAAPATVPLTGSQAQLTVSNLAPGTHTITAAYSGDANFLASTSTVLTQTVIRPALALALTSTPNPSLAGQAVTFAASLSGGTGDYAGTVQFLDGGMTVGTAAVVNGQARFATSALSAGSHTITAQYQRVWIWGTESAQASLTQVVRDAIRLSSAAAPIASAFAPDETVSLFNVSGLKGDAVATSLPLTTSLGGVTVTITDSAGVNRQASLYGVFASAKQVNFVVPGDTAVGPAVLTISAPGGITVSPTMNIQRVAPGIFTANANGQGVYAGQIVHAHADGSQTIESSAMFDSSSNSYVANPVNFGAADDQVYLVLYGTGIRHRSGDDKATATVNGVSVSVLTAAQGTWPGLDQVNLSLPRSLAGAGTVKILITVEGAATNGVEVLIQ